MSTERRAAYERARRPGERQDRRTHILDGTRSMLATTPAATDLTIVQIAEAAGLSPAGLYTYFSGKEAVLLAILADDLATWLHTLADAIEQYDQPTAASTAAIAVDTLRTTPHLPALLVDLSTSLEAGAPDDDIDEFKRSARHSIQRAAQALDTAQPGIDGRAALRYLRALMIGLWTFGTSRAPNDSLVQSQLDWFNDELRRSFTATLRGLTSE